MVLTYIELDQRKLLLLPGSAFVLSISLACMRRFLEQALGESEGNKCNTDPISHDLTKRNIFPIARLGSEFTQLNSTSDRAS